MKLTTGMVALALAVGTAWAQNPAIIQNTKDALQKVQQEKTAASNAALQGTTPSKPSGAVPAKAPANAPTVVPTKAPAAPPKPAIVPAKTPVQAAPAKPQVVPAKATPATTAAPAKNGAPAKAAAPAPTQATSKAQAPAKAQTAAKTQSPMAPKVIPAKPAVKVAAKPEVKVSPKAVQAKAAAEPKANAEASSQADAPKAEKQEDKKYSMTGKRDPFISPVVNRQGGSGCSTGKKCLDIEQIALHGVVKSDNGMIAVVTNSLNKAYFLRENDPVFNGYVVKITVDSIVFKQTFQDRLGKSFTKDVVKRIQTPAV
jgi:Tfp pilus assembly protein PilP